MECARQSFVAGRGYIGGDPHDSLSRARDNGLRPRTTLRSNIRPMYIYICVMYFKTSGIEQNNSASLSEWRSFIFASVAGDVSARARRRCRLTRFPSVWYDRCHMPFSVGYPSPKPKMQSSQQMHSKQNKCKLHIWMLSRSKMKMS